jgi:hypothetical protein
MPITEEYASYVECLEEKLSDVDPEFFLTSGMVQENWRAASKPKRHLATRASIHGFHHKLCEDSGCYLPSPQCVCLHCGSSASSVLHCVECGGIPWLGFLDLT